VNTPGTDRLTAACGSGLVGGLCGAVLAAFASSLRESTLAGAALIGLWAILGAWAGRGGGALTGAGLGLLASASGQVLGTTPGVVLTVLACAALGGWLRWVHEDRRATERGNAPRAVRGCEAGLRTGSGEPAMTVRSRGASGGDLRPTPAASCKPLQANCKPAAKPSP
jgi:hypothetical protein